MRSSHSRLIRGIALATTLLMLCATALANTGKETDEDGGVWDWDSGTYTAPDGRVVSITSDEGGDNDSGSSSDSGRDSGADSDGTRAVVNDDGSITIITNEEDIVRNEDGSIVIESGQIKTVEQQKEDEMTGDEVWAQGMGQAAITNGTYTPTFYFDGSGAMTEVPVEYMGVYRSMIRLNGESVLVDTANLIWTTEAPAEKVLAVVTAKTYARLFAKSSKKSLVMDKVYNGTVLRVLKTDKNWTFVDYNGERGYIQTSVLKFYENEKREYQSGFIATKSGHTYGNSTVHVRNDPKGSQQEEYPVGTRITVFEDDGTWCRIEVEGHMCYIQRKFMVYEE